EEKADCQDGPGKNHRARCPGRIFELASALCEYGSWLGVRPSKFGAAGFFLWCEFHEFDPRLIRVVEIQLPLAIAPELWLFGEMRAVPRQLLARCLNGGSAQRNVNHDGWQALAGVEREIDHGFAPGWALGHL